MFTNFKEYLMKKLNRLKEKQVEATKKSVGRPKKIEAITKNVTVPDPVVPPKKKAEPKKVCTYEEHNCVAIQLINRLLCMIEEYEYNIKRIQDHPTLPDTTKSDIQNYINKNIITALWVLSPAFDLITPYPRAKIFKTLFTKSANKGVPGILDEKKYI